jgi:glycosyltransferase involved in cell wall biosynthesis
MSSSVLTVLMSVFNGEAFLAESVESILKQTFHDFEFLIVDDGSTDTTAEILSKYAASDARIRVIRHENRGRAESLNIGIRLAAGDYIARMDADDIALPGRFALQMEFLERHVEVGVLGGAVELINPQGQGLETIRPPLEDEAIRSVMLEYNPIYHPTVMMRKDAVLAAGGYRRALLDADDFDLWLRIGEHSQLANLDHTLLKYRIHGSQVTVRNMRHQIMCVIAARTAALRKRGTPDPLSGVEEITQEFLKTLNVSAEQIDRELAGCCYQYLRLLKQSDPEASLYVLESLSELAGSEAVSRSFLANEWLENANFQYRRGKPIKALMSAWRAVLLRPLVIGRPFKRAFKRLTAEFKA